MRTVSKIKEKVTTCDPKSGDRATESLLKAAGLLVGGLCQGIVFYVMKPSRQLLVLYSLLCRKAIETVIDLVLSYPIRRFKK